MDQTANYRIKIPGKLTKDWLTLETRMEIEVEIIEGKPFTTTLSGKLDQAALIGLLRSLYNYGLPLISVECVDFNKDMAR
jgi:hypothetical protein